MKKRTLLFISFITGMIFLDAVLFSFWMHQKTTHSLQSVSAKDNKPFDYKTEEQKLKRKLNQSSDIESVYRQFVNDFQFYDQSVIHSLAHVVGEELYNQQGMNGVLVCDESFSFGCYHGFFGLALQKEGDKIIPEADTICKKKQTSPTDLNGCMHGLGHGIVITQGYTYDDLLGALKKCDLLSSFSQAPCYNGVFMEYNRRVPFAAYGQNLGVREFSKENPYHPCDRLPTRYKSECYVEQPAWWSVTVSGLTYEEKMTTIGNLCNTIREHGYEAQCFRGIARAIPLGTNVEKAKKSMTQYCSLVPSRDGKDYCLESAVQILIAQGELSAKELCLQMSQNQQNSCIKTAETFACQELHKCI